MWHAINKIRAQNSQAVSSLFKISRSLFNWQNSFFFFFMKWQKPTDSETNSNVYRLIIFLMRCWAWTVEVKNCHRLCCCVCVNCSLCNRWPTMMYKNMSCVLTQWIRWAVRRLAVAWVPVLSATNTIRSRPRTFPPHPSPHPSLGLHILRCLRFQTRCRRLNNKVRQLPMDN